MLRLLMLTVVLAASIVTPSWAINGDAMALNSGGTSGSNAVLNDNGYVGTYINLASPGDVTVTVNASGSAFGGANPNMNIWLGDTLTSFDVTPGAFNNYQHTFTNLPAGTHFLRTEYNNDRDTSRALTIGSVNISGATILNSDTNSNALAAADDYIENFRKGPAQVSLIGATPGASVEVTLKRHDFNFGTTVPGVFNDTLIGPPGSPWLDDSAPNFNATNYKQALIDNRFNSLSPENAGKWGSNETTPDVLNTMFGNGRPFVPYIDYIADFAAANNMGYRAHNLIWGPNNQQPGWVVDLLNQAEGGSQSAADDLRAEISERVQYYVQDRAQQFYEIDLYNESWHTGVNTFGSSNNYWDIYGASGIAEVYKEVKDAVVVGGGSAAVFVNEYSVLQGQGGDYYANWYTSHIDDIQNAGKDLYGENENVVTGIGFQYYVSGLSGHDPSRIYASMQNLAVQGLPMSLTEWGGTGANNPSDEAEAAVILNETARLVFGMPGATGITLWNLRNTPGTFAPVGTLYDEDWTIRDPGVAWQALMGQWDTDLMLDVDPNGRIDFTGFYGQYEVTIGGETFDLDLTKGITEYSFIVDIPPDFNDDNMVDGTDLGIWETAYGVNASGDADGDGDSDGSDFLIWQQWAGYDANPLAANSAAVPEPAGLTLLAVGIALLRRRRWRSQSHGIAVLREK